MKLIHCADFHLNSPMRSNLPPEKARVRREELLTRFGELAGFADEEGVSAILIAGDLFDGERISQKSAQYVLNTVRNYPDLHFFYLSGNHDSSRTFASEEALPENLHLFYDRWSSYQLGEQVEIHGCESSTGADPALLNPDADKFNIVLMHGQAVRYNTTEEGLISLPRIADKGVDYLALGHIHSFWTEKIDERCIACYSGCPEGRGFDECGIKGVVMLEIDEEKKQLIRHDLHPFAKRTLHTLELDVSELSTQIELENRLRELLLPIPHDDMVKVEVTGMLGADTLMDIHRLERLGGVFYLKIEDKTRLKIEEKDYANDLSLKGEFIRLVMASELGEAEKEKVIACGLRTLRGEEPES